MKNNIQDLEVLSNLLDTRFKGPFGFRFGLDGLIGLIPGFGDIITNFMGGYIILRAIHMGYPASVILRMLTNIFIDTAFQSLPLVGNILDFFIKSNRRNYKIIKEYEDSPAFTKQRSLLWNVCMLTFVLSSLIAMTALTLIFAVYVVQWVLSTI